ncbi:MAG: guanylate kinase [Clostridia bacterium]|nr:guanylate kinase [Clostridia bacterium]
MRLRVQDMANKDGLLILFSGPSGVGKDTVLDVVLNKNKELQKSISLTTRNIRENETDGKDYYFISTPDFEKMIADGEVLEYAKYGSNLYGTPKAPIDKWLSEGKNVILKIEVQGAENIKKLYPDSVGIFLLPPSMTVLEDRLRSRGTEDEDDVKKRLEIAQDEMRRSLNYDYFVINEDIERASDDVLTIIKALDFSNKKMNNYLSEVIDNV